MKPWLGSLLVASLSASPTAALADWRSEGPYQGNVTDVAVDPLKPDTIYAATSGGGVWRSDDGAATWTLPGDEMVSRNVKWIEADPGAPGTVWAGIEAHGSAGLWRSLDRGKTWAVVRVGGGSYAVGQPVAFAASDPKIVFVPSSNLHYRSADGGKTWVSFRVDGQDAYAFAVDPKNPRLVYAGGQGSEHSLSRSQDGGRTWQPFGEGLGKGAIRHLIVSPTRPGTLYVQSGFGQVHRSSDAGATWTELELGLGGTDELYSLKADPHDPDVLLAATKEGLRRSSDNGDTWRTVGEGTGSYLIQGIAFDPRREDAVYAGAGGSGFYKSTDGGATFTAAGKGLAAGWTEKIWAPPNGAGPVFAQMSVGLFRMDGPGAWTEIQAPFKPGEPAEIDGIVFDKDLPKRVYAHDGGRWWRSEDAGRAWTAIEVPGPSMMKMMKGKIAEPGFKSLVQDPADAKTFYAGNWTSHEPGTVVFKTITGGKKWEPAAAGLTSESVTLLRSAAPGTVFAVGGKDGIFKTSDAGRTWKLVRAGEVKELAIDPGKPERLYAATEKGLFRSADTGETWTRAAGIKDDDVTTVAVSKDGQAFAGTFHGVLRSADGGATWTPFPGLVNTDVRALAIAGGSPARLYAGLAGGSVFSTELP